MEGIGVSMNLFCKKSKSPVLWWNSSYIYSIAYMATPKYTPESRSIVWSPWTQVPQPSCAIYRPISCYVADDNASHLSLGPKCKSNLCTFCSYTNARLIRSLSSISDNREKSWKVFNYPITQYTPGNLCIWLHSFSWVFTIAVGLPI